MDNVTHSLTGLALARAGLDRICPRAVPLLFFSANIPDIDSFSLLGGPLEYLKIHRGYTHSVVCLPLIALAAVFLVAMLFRQKLPWGRAWLLCAIGVASHLLLDWTNDYGIRLLLPFSSHWFALDLNSLYDVVILAVLVFAAVWPLLERLVNGEIGDKRPVGRGAAVFALLFFALYDGGRVLLHSRAMAQLNSVLYDGEIPVQTAALPNPYSPLHWAGIVETSRSFRKLPLHVLQPLEPHNALVFYKLPMAGSLEIAKQTEPFRYFLYFARFPVWSKDTGWDKDKPIVRVELFDLRFGVPGDSHFYCLAVEDTQGHVLKSGFGF